MGLCDWLLSPVRPVRFPTHKAVDCRGDNTQGRCELSSRARTEPNRKHKKTEPRVRTLRPKVGHKHTCLIKRYAP